MSDDASTPQKPVLAAGPCPVTISQSPVEIPLGQQGVTVKLGFQYFLVARPSTQVLKIYIGPRGHYFGLIGQTGKTELDLDNISGTGQGTGLQIVVAGVDEDKKPIPITSNPFGNAQYANAIVDPSNNQTISVSFTTSVAMNKRVRFPFDVVILNTSTGAFSYAMATINFV